MRAGLSDRRADLQHQTAPRNSRGEAIPTFTTYATVWARKEDIRGREFFAAQQLNIESPTTFTIRFRADMLNTDRMIVDGVIYNIRNINEVPRRKWLNILATRLPT